MRVFAYCAESFADAMRDVAGVPPLTCPPLSAATFDPVSLVGYELLMFDLHGHPAAAEWYGDANLVALTAEAVRKVHLNGAVVFALSCYLADANSPMLDSLLDAGASYVIAGDGANYAGVERVFGAGTLGQWFRRFYSNGMAATRALWLAKQTVKPQLLTRPEEAKDTLGFKAFCRAGVE